MPTVTGIIESAVYVADVVKSVKFYKELFEVESIDSIHVEEAEERRVALNINDRQVFLIFPLDKQFTDQQTPGGVIPKHGATGDVHLCFSIPSDSLDHWRAHLAKKGVNIESEVNWPRGGTSFYFRDPDNNCIELATPGIWSIY